MDGFSSLPSFDYFSSPSSLPLPSSRFLVSSFTVFCFWFAVGMGGWMYGMGGIVETPGDTGEEIQGAPCTAQLLLGEAAHVAVKTPQLRVALVVGAATPALHHQPFHR